MITKIKISIIYLSVFLVLSSLCCQLAFSQKHKSKHKKQTRKKTITLAPEITINLKSWSSFESDDKKVAFKLPTKTLEISKKSLNKTANGKDINLYQYGAIDNGIIYLVNYYKGICEGLDKETKSLEVVKFALGYVQSEETIFSDKYLEFQKDDIEFIGEEIISKEKDNQVKHFKVLADEKNFYLLVVAYQDNVNKLYTDEQIDKFFRYFTVRK